MGIYSESTDYTDRTFKIDDRLIGFADAHVTAFLGEMNIIEDDLTLPISLLTQLAVAIGSHIACVEKAAGEDTLLLDKAKQYKLAAENLKSVITRKSLGLIDPLLPSNGFLSFDIGRG
jgi:hypothetical protein